MIDTLANAKVTVHSFQYYRGLAYRASLQDTLARMDFSVVLPIMIAFLFRGSKRYFCPLGRKVCLLASTFIAQRTKICAMTPANAYTKVFPMRKTKLAPFFNMARSKLSHRGKSICNLSASDVTILMETVIVTVLGH